MWHDILIRKLGRHSFLSKDDLSHLRKLPGHKRTAERNEDIVRQGDRPELSVVVLEGMLARYHTLPKGKRQYLSFHIAGDMPDAQALFLETMDHSLCALDKASIVLVPHNALTKIFSERPNVGFALWRETLIDAAIFRATITNNSSRSLQTRLAHFFCEQYYRANQVGLVKSSSCRLPLTQTQIAETLASSLPSVSRTFLKLRKSRAVDFRNGVLHVKNWDTLIRLGDFNPDYLHLKKPKPV